MDRIKTARRAAGMAVIGSLAALTATAWAAGAAAGSTNNPVTIVFERNQQPVQSEVPIALTFPNGDTNEAIPDSAIDAIDAVGTAMAAQQGPNALIAECSMASKAHEGARTGNVSYKVGGKVIAIKGTWSRGRSGSSICGAKLFIPREQSQASSSQEPVSAQSMSQDEGLPNMGYKVLSSRLDSKEMSVQIVVQAAVGAPITVIIDGSGLHNVSEGGDAPAAR